MNLAGVGLVRQSKDGKYSVEFLNPGKLESLAVTRRKLCSTSSYEHLSQGFDQ